MGSDFYRYKILIVTAVAILILSDAGMMLYSSQVSSSDRSGRQELAAQMTEIQLLRADVARAEAIRLVMPTTKKDCERFKESLPSTRSGYSLITSELGDVGHNAGLQISALEFHSADIPARDLTEVSVDASVTGNYKSIMQFVNGVQRSKNYYIVESLSLATDTSGVPGAPGTVRVNVHLKSYFKAAA
jgi:type IV pilus assembly protein PilO